MRRNCQFLCVCVCVECACVCVCVLCVCCVCVVDVCVFVFMCSTPFIHKICVIKNTTRIAFLNFLSSTQGPPPVVPVHVDARADSMPKPRNALEAAQIRDQKFEATRAEVVSAPGFREVSVKRIYL